MYILDRSQMSLIKVVERSFIDVVALGVYVKECIYECTYVREEESI